VWRVEIIFGAIAIAVKSVAHVGAHTDVAREAAGIDGNVGMEVDALAYMRFGAHADHTATFQ
jgi:hypothetical protein